MSDLAPGRGIGLRSGDQVTVAVGLCVGLALLAGWWSARFDGARWPVSIDVAPPLPLDDRIDPNTASWPELTLLPGVGRTLAGRIVESRRRDGPFRSADDLRRVKGIGPATVEKLRPRLRNVGTR